MSTIRIGKATKVATLDSFFDEIVANEQIQPTISRQRTDKIKSDIWILHVIPNPYVPKPHKSIDDNMIFELFKNDYIQEHRNASDDDIRSKLTKNMKQKYKGICTKKVDFMEESVNVSKKWLYCVQKVITDGNHKIPQTRKTFDYYNLCNGFKKSSKKEWNKLDKETKQIWRQKFVNFMDHITKEAMNIYEMDSN